MNQNEIMNNTKMIRKIPMQERTVQPITLAVCDDEAADCSLIADMVTDILKEEQIIAEVIKFDSGSTLLRAIEDGAVFQMILLDVIMPALDGMTLAAALRKQENDAAIIFISINREMALNGYEVQASRYLAKPVDCKKLREALLYCYDTYCTQKEILLPTRMGERRVRIEDILYAESRERCTLLTLSTGTLMVNMMISELATLLQSDEFIFCHRTVLVNLACVESIRRLEFKLKNGTTLPISKYRLPEVKAQLIHYLGH